MKLVYALQILLWFFIGYWILKWAGFLSWPFFILGNLPSVFFQPHNNHQYEKSYRPLCFFG
jgi:hypothetical protein